MSLSRVLRQAAGYAKTGVGFGGAVLKHSLVPARLLREVLPERGLVLDLGCGEGMLGNLVARECPGLRLVGIDRNPEKIALANRNATPNARFEVGDVFEAVFSGARAVIFNDMLHHHPLPRQMELLQKAATFLDETGVLVLKEVDADDASDRVWTRFWDRRLYPEDGLYFRSAAEWRRVIAALGFEVLRVERVGHPWPASRTVFICRRARRVLTNAPAVAAGEEASQVFVTGATGFLGSHLVERLLRHGIDSHPVRITLLARDPMRLSPEVRSRCRVLEGRIEDLPSHRGALEGTEYVFHLAAAKDFFGGEEIFRRNIDGTRAVIETFEGCSKLRRLVFASSMGAVDRTAEDDCSGPMGMHSKPRPSSAYGRAKLESEKRFQASGLPFTILRLPWCYGPGMTPETHVRALFERVRRGSAVTRFDWPGRISVLEATECARALVFAAIHKETMRRTLYVSDGEPISFGALFREMGKYEGREAGGVKLPPVIIRTVRRWRGRLPLTLRSLVEDVLWVDDSEFRALGFEPAPRPAHFLLSLARWIQDERRPSLHRTVSLVTGAASGIGRALAIQIAASGRSTILVDRDPAVETQATTLLGARAWVADLATLTGLEGVQQQIVKEGDLTWLFNCAGVGLRAPVGGDTGVRVNAMLDVNVRALTALTAVAVHQFQNAGAGVVVNVASSAALQPLPGMAVYAASKAYVLNFSEAVAAELEGRDAGSTVAVITACPGGVATRFQETAGVRRLEHEKLLTPEEVARVLIRRAVAARSRTIFIGGRGRVMSLAARLLPRRVNVRLWKVLMRHAR